MNLDTIKEYFQNVIDLLEQLFILIKRLVNTEDKTLDNLVDAADKAGLGDAFNTLVEDAKK